MQISQSYYSILLLLRHPGIYFSQSVILRFWEKDLRKICDYDNKGEEHRVFKEVSSYYRKNKSIRRSRVIFYQAQSRFHTE